MITMKWKIRENDMGIIRLHSFYLEVLEDAVQ